MRLHRPLAFLAAALVLAAGGSRAAAEEPAKDEDRALVFGDGVARLSVVHDPSLGTLTLRYVGGTKKVVSAPVVTIREESGSRKVALATLEPNVWRLYEPALLEDDAQLAATVEIEADGRMYTENLVRSLWTSAEPKVAEHGGRVVSFRDCPAHVEVVRDVRAGTLTIYPLAGTVLLEAPVIEVSPRIDGTAAKVTATKVEGEAGVWRASSEILKREHLDGSKVRITLGGKACEAPLPAPRRRTVLVVAGGPRVEVVRDEKARTVTFVALDETLDGKAYVLERPEIVVEDERGPRVYALEKVEGEPRAWRLATFVPASSVDATLRFTLNRKKVEAKVRLTPFPPPS